MWLTRKWGYVYWMALYPLVYDGLLREKRIVKARQRLPFLVMVELGENWSWLLTIWGQLSDVNERWNSIFTFFRFIHDIVNILPIFKSFISIRILHNEVTPNFFTKEGLKHLYLRCLLRIYFHLQAYSIMTRFTWCLKFNLWFKVASCRNIFSNWHISNIYFFFIYFLQTRISCNILSASVLQIPFFRDGWSSSHNEVVSKAFTNHNQVKCLPILLNSRQP